jgi:hypothetical protein
MAVFHALVFSLFIKTQASEILHQWRKMTVLEVQFHSK